MFRVTLVIKRRAITLCATAAPCSHDTFVRSLHHATTFVAPEMLSRARLPRQREYRLRDLRAVGFSDKGDPRGETHGAIHMHPFLSGDPLTVNG